MLIFMMRCHGEMIASGVIPKREASRTTKVYNMHSNAVPRRLEELLRNIEGQKLTKAKSKRVLRKMFVNDTNAWRAISTGCSFSKSAQSFLRINSLSDVVNPL